MHLLRCIFPILLLLLVGCGSPEVQQTVSASKASAIEQVEGEILIGITSSEIRAARASTFLEGAKETGRIQLKLPEVENAKKVSRALRDSPAATEIIKLQLPAEMSVEQAIAELADRTDILYAEPNYIVHRAVIPNDPLFDQQWGLQNTGQVLDGDKGVTVGTLGADIDAPFAWDITTGAGNSTVAIIDSGIDYNHPDLTANIWQNPGESGTDGQGQDKATNNLDDDNNGYIDDLHGWNFIANNRLPLDDDVDGHGTHVAGIIGAIGDNGLGVSGVNWNVRMMPLKFLDSFGNGDLFNAVAAYNYAIKMGVRVINASYTYPQSCTVTTPSMAERSVIDLARSAGILVIAAAGNSGCDNSRYPFYPGSHPLDNIISVAATDPVDFRVSWSNYGQSSVDLGAPGFNIYSTIRQGMTGLDGRSGYNYMSGTSMAAPHVSGSASLLLSLHPQLTYAEVRDALLLSVDELPSLQGRVTSNGRLNTARALSLDFNQTAPTAPSDLGIDHIAPNEITLSWRDLSSNESAFIVERSEGGSYTQLGLVDANVTTFIDSSPPDGVQISYRVKAVAGVNFSGYSNTASSFIPLTPPSGLGALVDINEGVQLFWFDQSTAEQGYTIERREINEPVFAQLVSLGANATSFLDTTVVTNHSYVYRVKALHSILGDSTYSAEITVLMAAAGGSGSDSRCFIATAAWGTPLAKEIDSLRRFRDQLLLPYSWGERLVETYYRLSPPLADFIAQHETLRTLTRWLLQPFVWLAEWATTAEAMEPNAPPAANPRAEMIIGFNPGTTDDQVRSLLRNEKLVLHKLQLVGDRLLALVKIADEEALTHWRQRLKSYTEVAYVELNRKIATH